MSSALMPFTIKTAPKPVGDKGISCWRFATSFDLKPLIVPAKKSLGVLFHIDEEKKLPHPVTIPQDFLDTAIIRFGKLPVSSWLHRLKRGSSTTIENNIVASHHRLFTVSHSYQWLLPTVVMSVEHTLITSMFIRRLHRSPMGFNHTNSSRS